MKITFSINGEIRSVESAPLARLLDLLRDKMALKGCKEGCGEGECGACSIIMDGRLVNACMVPAIQAAGSSLRSIEGLAQGGKPDALQQAYIDEGAVQCGFCIPGMVLASRSLLQDKPKPDLDEIRVALSGNLCRCTGYARIYAAVNKAIEKGYAPRREDPLARPGDPEFTPQFEESEKNRFFRPSSLKEALGILQEHPDTLILSGNTDIGPEMKSGRISPQKVMDIFSLPELKSIELEGQNIRIGAAVTNSQIMENPLLSAHLPALVKAAACCAAPAIRNRASIGGNLCTASGAADLPVPLMALGAFIEIASARGGTRKLPLPEFITGYRKNALAPGELLTAVLVPMPSPNTRQVFFKRGSRAALTLSRVSIALALELEDGCIRSACAATGSMSPIPKRMPGLEAALNGQKLDAALIEKAVHTVHDECQPRKSAAFRKAIAANLVRRFLEESLSR